MDGPGWDMVYFERENPAGSISLDFVIIELSYDGINWYTVFAWDGVPGGVIGTNIDGHATSPPDVDGEVDNEQIPLGQLYGSPPFQTGVAIDIGPWAPAGYSYHLVRLTDPSGGDPAEVDAVQRLN